MFSVPLETNRFIIRKFTKKDLKTFLEFMLDEESTHYLAFEPDQKTEAGAKALFDYVCSAYDSEEPVHSYAIAEKSTDRYVGSCGFAPYDEGIYECYYSINKAEWGKGIATEATKAMAEQLAQTHQVRAYCHPENYAAHAVAKKAGFIPQGMSSHKNFGIEGELFIYNINS
jgi:RimJ/RimL family protein N-acetyltransferase